MRDGISHVALSKKISPRADKRYPRLKNSGSTETEAFQKLLPTTLTSICIDSLNFASDSSESYLIVHIKLMKANTVNIAVLIQAGRISEWRLRLICAASPEAFGTVQVKELPSSVDHFADGSP